MKRQLRGKTEKNFSIKKAVCSGSPGLSASGKSTLALEVENALYGRSRLTYVLDGDNIRHGLNNNLGFSPEESGREYPPHRRGIETVRGFRRHRNHRVYLNPIARIGTTRERWLRMGVLSRFSSIVRWRCVRNVIRRDCTKKRGQVKSRSSRESARPTKRRIIRS